MGSRGWEGLGRKRGGRRGRGDRIRYERRKGRYTEGQEIEQRSVAMGDGELKVATRKSQTPEKEKAPRNQRG